MKQLIILIFLSLLLWNCTSVEQTEIDNSFYNLNKKITRFIEDPNNKSELPKRLELEKQPFFNIDNYKESSIAYISAQIPNLSRLMSSYTPQGANHMDEITLFTVHSLRLVELVCKKSLQQNRRLDPQLISILYSYTEMCMVMSLEEKHPEKNSSETASLALYISKIYWSHFDLNQRNSILQLSNNGCLSSKREVVKIMNEFKKCGL